jgi:fatty-acyl-CoA synthase
MTVISSGGQRLDNLLSRAAQSHPQREAVVFGDVSRTYAEVHDRACQLAGALAAAGVEAGDRVAFWIPNMPEFVEILFGISRLAAIGVPLDHWWTWENAQTALQQTRPKVLLVGAAQAELLEGQQQALQAAGIELVLRMDESTGDSAYGTYADFLASAQPRLELTPVQAEDPAVIFFTSGSTGRSKGAVHTHRSLLSAAATMSVELGLEDDERTLHFLPLFSSCMEHLLPLTYMAATHVILPKFDAAGVWEAIEKHGVTHFDAIPTTLRRILDVAPATLPTSLRSISYASERMPEPLIKALVERMPGVKFVQFYGMMEQLCLTVLEPSDQIRRIGTIGRPMQGAELYVLNADGQRAARGESGEIVGRSPSLFAGYWLDDEATAKVMLDGWMKTGDIGHFEADGFLKLDGRAKEIIKSGGLTVIPSEVEHVLTHHPSVSEAAVVGIPDDVWGEAVHAFVIPVAGLTVTESELKLFCRERLASYKTPKAIHVVSELPTTGIGKIARNQVRAQILAQVKTV